MKRTIAAVLGLALMTSTALAANIPYDEAIGASNVAPGNTIDLKFSDFDNTSGITGYLDTANFSISTKKITKGANLVKEIKIDDDDGVVRIVLNQNMEQAVPNGENLVIDTLSIKAKQNNGDVTRNQTFTKEDIALKIGHVIHEIDLTGSIDTLQEGYNKLISSGDYAYSDVTYSEGDLIIEGRAYKGDKIFVDANFDANATVLKSFADADLRFINLETNGLPTNFKVYLTAEEDEYIYKVVDGKLVDAGLKWSDDDYAFTGKVRTSTSYVISDIELETVSTDEGVENETPEVTNPDTGANDVVGIAAALAVVSLVAAGAVSLKK